MKTWLILLLIVVVVGCVVGHIPTKVYHALYCDRMNVDGIHCDRWATTCGQLDCGNTPTPPPIVDPSPDPDPNTGRYQSNPVP